MEEPKSGKSGEQKDEQGFDPEDIYAEETTEEKIKRAGDILSDAADKGVDIARDIFKRVRHFSSEATELTKLKIEIRNLKGQREKLFNEMGGGLWDLFKTGKMADVEGTFADKFQRLKEIEDAIAEKEESAKNISL